ncbi:MAG: AraC family transcriptional regulator [Acidobacteria bacterium OLB17]|nr:MAG: AraC family transcriptional regulator [Acidobacteria bacterium OLB17]MCZ2390353.1 AraC family transcriptional regulator [Acidobacteriota bacterium]
MPIDGLTICTKQAQVEMSNGMHYHEMPTICFLVKGGGIEKRKNTDYERSANDARFYYAGEPHHSDIRVVPSKCVNLEFDERFLEHYEISEFLIDSAVNGRLDVKFAMLRMYREFLTGDGLSGASIEMLLLGLVANAKSSRTSKPEWLARLREILNDHWADDLGLSELASILGVHPVTISKYFSKCFSCTLGEYVRKLRVNKSLTLIKSRDLPLTDVALECGFTDQSHFIRNFKRQTGFLPKEFKRL